MKKFKKIYLICLALASLILAIGLSVWVKYSDKAISNLLSSEKSVQVFFTRDKDIKLTGENYEEFVGIFSQFNFHLNIVETIGRKTGLFVTYRMGIPFTCQFTDDGDSQNNSMQIFTDVVVLNDMVYSVEPERILAYDLDDFLEGLESKRKGQE